MRAARRVQGSERRRPGLDLSQERSEAAARLERRLDRERRARAESESIAERALRDLYLKQRLLTLLKSIAVAANESRAIEDGLEVALQKVCEYTGWPVGHALLSSRDGSAISSAKLWHLEDATRFHKFRKVSESYAFARGVGLPGRVLASGRPAWITDVGNDPNFPRRAAAKEVGLTAGFAYPLMVGREVAAVMEFFSREAVPPDEALLDAMGQIGTQLGRVVERQQAEASLKRSQAELARSNADLERFAYVASHDLQEPLRTVASHLQLLERGYRDQLDERAREFITFAVDGAKRMRTLITDVLSYSRVTSQGRPFEATACEDVLDAVIVNLRVAIEESGAVITHDPLPTVAADASQLGQLLQNLIGNAIKFRGPEPPRIHVSAERHGEEWRLSVRDNGIGMEPKYLKRIFAIFERLHGRAEYPGTGIGLALCEKIVDRHGGHIWAESRIGEGTTFHFTLPEQEVAAPSLRLTA